MRNLLLILLLTSCGGRALLTLPEIDFNHSDDDKPSVSIQSSRVAKCNLLAYQNRCTYSYDGRRQLTVNDLYSVYCVNQYRQCMGI